MSNQLICKALKFVIVVANVSILGGAIAQSAQSKVKNPFDEVKAAEWTTDLHPSIGSPTAPIKIVFFVDYQCPSCRSSDPVVRKAASVRPDVALIYREFPLKYHQFARSAAAVAENAREHGTFEVAHKRLMQGQSLTAEAIKDAARKARVSTKESGQATARIESDQKIERRSNLSSVPCFVVIDKDKATLMTKQELLDFLKTKHSQVPDATNH